MPLSLSHGEASSPETRLPTGCKPNGQAEYVRIAAQKGAFAAAQGVFPSAAPYGFAGDPQRTGGRRMQAEPTLRGMGNAIYASRGRVSHAGWELRDMGVGLKFQHASVGDTYATRTNPNCA